MRQALIAQALGAQGDVFGPLRDVTPQPAALPEVPETPLDAETAEAVADEIVDDETGWRHGAMPPKPEGFTEEEQGAIEDVFGDASGDEDVAIERAWLQKELAKGLGAKGTEAVTAAVADPKLTAARARELRDVGGRPPEPGGESQPRSGARGPVVRFIHAADIHFRARDPEPALKSLAKIAEVAREREVDLIIVAGDLFDAPIRNSDADSHAEAARRLRRLAGRRAGGERAGHAEP